MSSGNIFISNLYFSFTQICTEDVYLQVTIFLDDFGQVGISESGIDDAVQKLIARG